MKKASSYPNLVDTPSSKYKTTSMKRTSSCSAVPPQHEQYALLHTNIIQGKTCMQEYHANNMSQKEREKALALCVLTPPEIESPEHFPKTCKCKKTFFKTLYGGGDMSTLYQNGGNIGYVSGGVFESRQERVYISLCLS